MSPNEKVQARCDAIVKDVVWSKDNLSKTGALSRVFGLKGEVAGIRWWYEVILDVQPPMCIADTMCRIDQIIDTLL